MTSPAPDTSPQLPLLAVLRQQPALRSYLVIRAADELLQA